MYKVSHLPISHTGLRMVIVEMIERNAFSDFRVVAKRLYGGVFTEMPQWGLRRIVEGNIIKRACFVAALAAQGR